MEENIEVKAVEVKEETSPQEKEAAALEQAIESGEVDSNYGFQDDGVYRVNVDTPPTQEADASEKQSADEVSVRNEPEASEEVREENEQESIEELTEQSEEKEEKETLEIVEESEQEIVQDAEQDVVQTNEYPEDVQKLVEFMQDTNGTLEDYVNLNRDYSKMDNTTLVYEYYKNNKPHLNNEDINFLMQKDFAYDEDVAEPSEIKAKQLAFKEELYKAQKHFNDSKEKILCRS